MFCVKAWFYLLIVLLPFAAHAQSEHYKTEGEITIQINPSLTIGSVVQAAMGISPDNLVASSKENYANALSNRSSSLFADTPELSFKHQNDNLISNQGLQEWESSLDMPLWMPGQKSAGRLKARMYERETAAFRKLSILQITGQVRELLWELKLADAVLLQSRENLLIAEALNNDIQKRIAAGNLPRRNSILGTKEVMNRKMEMVDAEAEYIHVAKRYESITGLVEIPDDIEEVIYASAENEDEAIDK
ncbi:MAG: TolC family protein, partial [Kordiimonadaceae bacterium]|nr:TolC family protein [Kordiimonadaceae bacterium]